MDVSQHLAIAKNIALLSLLTRIPETPEHNSAVGDRAMVRKGEHLLSSESVISSIIWPFYLLHRVIQRRSQPFASRSMQMHAGVQSVRIVVNNGSLSVVEEGFQRISSILEKALLQCKPQLNIQRTCPNSGQIRR
jgi:hypothetical protein